MRRTITGLFKSLEHTVNAIREIEGRGLANNQISLVAKTQLNNQESFYAEYAADLTAPGAENVFGHLNDVLVQTPKFEVEDLGEIAAAGPLGGILMREADTGLASALVSAYGVTSDRAHYLTEQVKEGRILTVIQTNNVKASEVANVIGDYGAKEVELWNKNLDHPTHPWNPS